MCSFASGHMAVTNIPFLPMQTSWMRFWQQPNKPSVWMRVRAQVHWHHLERHEVRGRVFSPLRYKTAELHLTLHFLTSFTQYIILSRNLTNLSISYACFNCYSSVPKVDTVYSAVGIWPSLSSPNMAPLLHLIIILITSTAQVLIQDPRIL